MFRLQDIQTIQNQKGNALVSIIAPMEPAFPASDKNRIIVKDLIKNAEERLKKDYDPVHAGHLIERINELESTLDYTHAGEGIALFVSDSFSRAVELTYSPPQIVSVGRSFHTRNLVSAYYKNPKYYILSLSLEHVRLYRGFGKSIIEIKNEYFPASYAGPARTEPVTRITRQDTEYEVLEDVRIFLRAVDEHLFKIAESEKLGIFLAGEEEYRSYLKNGKSGKYVAGEVHGNYVHHSYQDLLEKVYPEVETVQRMELQKELDGLQDSIGYNLYAKGVTDVWKATKLGQVRKLFVEESYSVPANTKVENELELILHTNGAPGIATHYDDIVDEIMEQVIYRDGAIYVVPDGQLESHGHIAAVLRFAI